MSGKSEAGFWMTFFMGHAHSFVVPTVQYYHTIAIAGFCCGENISRRVRIREKLIRYNKNIATVYPVTTQAISLPCSIKHTTQF